MYEGEYRNGKKFGPGTYRYADGHTYEGTLDEMDKKTGKGRLTSTTGNIYEGDFKDDQMSGVGQMRYRKPPRLTRGLIV